MASVRANTQEDGDLDRTDLEKEEIARTQPILKENEARGVKLGKMEVERLYHNAIRGAFVHDNPMATALMAKVNCPFMKKYWELWSSSDPLGELSRDFTPNSKKRKASTGNDGNTAEKRPRVVGSSDQVEHADTQTASVPIPVPSKAPQSTAATPAKSSSERSKEQHIEHNRTY
ncbi:hypothetical protein OEA41_004075 [Lepraria neglecta]|uniref:Uncharacterized protein n=1 Tax=Lepraria neglecta TaxID=209136 RepID=A0AAD9Z5U0_9LECA|nr:hypothetical protein OEA41_004075 [Lepraria neglecta]